MYSFYEIKPNLVVYVYNVWKDRRKKMKTMTKENVVIPYNMLSK